MKKGQEKEAGYCLIMFSSGFENTLTQNIQNSENVITLKQLSVF